MDTAQEIVNKSGNEFHYQVVKYLRDKGWEVQVSPYYNDNATDKPREIDLVAEYAHDVYSFGTKWLGTINVKLFIECKYINEETVFWFDNKNRNEAVSRAMRDTGMSHPNQNGNIDNLHYLSGNEKVAKLFSSKPDKSSENETFYKAINQSLNAFVYLRSSPTLYEDGNPKSSQIKLRINYPVIVCSNFDKLYYKDVTEEDDKIENIDGNFQLELNYAYLSSDRQSHQEYFLIDVVSFEKIEEFLSVIQEDIKIVSSDLVFRLRD